MKARKNARVKIHLNRRLPPCEWREVVLPECDNDFDDDEEAEAVLSVMLVLFVLVDFLSSSLSKAFFFFREFHVNWLKDDNDAISLTSMP